MLRPIAIATAISGTLDILFAMILTVAFGRHIGDMLRFVASGPFPAATALGTAGAILGLVVHFALMAIMATGLILFVRWKPERLETPAPHRHRLWCHHLFRDELGRRAATLRDAAAAQDTIDRHSGLRAHRAGWDSDGLCCARLFTRSAPIHLRISRISVTRSPMIVCVCNRLTEDEVREAAAKGARTPERAYARLGCEVQCGCCLDYAQEIIAEAPAKPAPLRLVA